jgi:hypothetical protein
MPRRQGLLQATYRLDHGPPDASATSTRLAVGFEVWSPSLPTSHSFVLAKYLEPEKVAEP